MQEKQHEHPFLCQQLTNRSGGQPVDNCSAVAWITSLLTRRGRNSLQFCYQRLNTSCKC